jgi:alpha-ketoglutarate-dependent sulfate ester dioxygenase
MADGTTGIEALLDVRRVAGRIGAEVGGARLSAELPDQTIEAIEAALHAHKVLFFRGQDGRVPRRGVAGW